MNAHLTHKNISWLDELEHTVVSGLHSSKVWAVVGIAALIALMITMIVFAAAFTDAPSSSSFYVYPTFPMVP